MIRFMSSAARITHPSQIVTDYLESIASSRFAPSQLTAADIDEAAHQILVSLHFFENQQQALSVVSTGVKEIRSLLFEPL